MPARFCAIERRLILFPRGLRMILAAAFVAGLAACSAPPRLNYDLSPAAGGFSSRAGHGQLVVLEPTAFPPIDSGSDRRPHQSQCGGLSERGAVGRSIADVGPGAPHRDLRKCASPARGRPTGDGRGLQPSNDHSPFRTRCRVAARSWFELYAEIIGPSGPHRRRQTFLRHRSGP